MRVCITILSLAVLMGLSACRSQQQAGGYDPMRELRSAQQAEVPLPATTPFDSSPETRAAFLESYRYGYRSGLVSLNVQFQKPDESDPVRTLGWREGATAGLNAHITGVMRKDQQ
jgi:hypothetical protein